MEYFMWNSFNFQSEPVILTPECTILDPEINLVISLHEVIIDILFKC